MKNIQIALIIIFLTFSVLFAGAFIQRFTAESDGEQIKLIWQSGVEENVKYFELLRGSDKEHLVTITKVEPKGDNSTYIYIDQNAYKVSNSFYAYGLVIVDKNGARSEPMNAFISHDVSTVKRTWGSIKDLFR
ncbi:MAG: hypothetical protein CR986_00705 [Ignavibacteriae bacterium]|nr:MAG: hypothetical protein CR986_00705 [Ignavibacteriota bacterium]